MRYLCQIRKMIYKKIKLIIYYLTIKKKLLLINQTLLIIEIISILILKKSFIFQSFGKKLQSIFFYVIFIQHLSRKEYQLFESINQQYSN